jgi:hypothetical protein
MERAPRPEGNFIDYYNTESREGKPLELGTRPRSRKAPPPQHWLGAGDGLWGGRSSCNEGLRIKGVRSWEDPEGRAMMLFLEVRRRGLISGLEPLIPLRRPRSGGQSREVEARFLARLP